MEEIVGIIFNNWTGLKMSIDHGMGGSTSLVAEKITSMINTIMDILSGKNFSWENISDVLEDMMDTEFNTVLEDNSSDEVAQIICELYLLWKADNQGVSLSAKIDQLPIKTPLQNEFQIQQVICESDTAGNSYMVEEISDNDGWTEVKRRR